MYYSNEDMVASIIHEKKQGSMTAFILGIPLTLVSLWLFIVVSSWWAITLGVVLSLIALCLVAAFFSDRANFKKFKKYTEFYDKGDVFLEQISMQASLPTGIIRSEIKALLDGKYFEDVVIYEETGQIIIASEKSKAQAESFKKYMSFYNKGELALSTVVSDVSVDALRTELQVLVDFGAIQTPMINEENDTIMIQTTPISTASVQTGDKAVDLLLKDGKAAVADFTRLRASIPDAQVKEKIDELILITNGIFNKLTIEPETYSQIRRFASYYLPKTLKLLTTYDELKNSDVHSANVGNMLKQINTTLDALITGFKKIYDSLYENKALDIETDIEVLETMLRQDGIYIVDDSAKSFKP